MSESQRIVGSIPVWFRIEDGLESVLYGAARLDRSNRLTAWHSMITGEPEIWCPDFQQMEPGGGLAQGGGEVFDGAVGRAQMPRPRRLRWMISRRWTCSATRMSLCWTMLGTAQNSNLAYDAGVRRAGGRA